ncbi:hypothetical protein BsWGS_27057 [Bradybaena similaris]
MHPQEVLVSHLLVQVTVHVRPLTAPLTEFLYSTGNLPVFLRPIRKSTNKSPAMHVTRSSQAMQTDHPGNYVFFFLLPFPIKFAYCHQVLKLVLSHDMSKEF